MRNVLLYSISNPYLSVRVRLVWVLYVHCSKTYCFRTRLSTYLKCLKTLFYQRATLVGCNEVCKPKGSGIVSHARAPVQTWTRARPCRCLPWAHPRQTCAAACYGTLEKEAHNTDLKFGYSQFSYRQYNAISRRLQCLIKYCTRHEVLLNCTLSLSLRSYW